jgi:hypothetical protein
LPSKRFSRALEGFCHDIAEFGAQCFDDEHSFPIGDGETGSVAIENEDTCVHLGGKDVRYFDLEECSLGLTSQRTSPQRRAIENSSIEVVSCAL